MATIADFKKQFPQYAEVEDSKLGDALHAKYYPDMPRDQFDQKVGLNTPKPTSFLADAGGSVVEGAGQVGSGIGGILGAMTGNYNNIVSRGGKTVEDWGQGIKSPGLRQREAAIDARMKAVENEGWQTQGGEALSAYADDPYAAGMKVFGQLPQLVGGFGAGKAATIAGGRLAARAAAKAVTAGATDLGAAAAATATGRIGAAGAIGFGATQQAGSVANETYQDAMSLPQSVYDQNDTYKKLVQTMSPEEARKEMAVTASREAAVEAGAVSLATMAAMPGAEKMMFIKGLRQTALKRVFGGLVFEGGQEFVEEGSGKVAQNLGVSRIDPNRNLAQGAMTAATQGGVLGGIMGGGTNLVAGHGPLPADQRGQLDPELRKAISDHAKNQEPYVPPPDPALRSKLEADAQMVAEAIPQVKAEDYLTMPPEVQARLQGIVRERAQSGQAKAYFAEVDALDADYAAKEQARTDTETQVFKDRASEQWTMARREQDVEQRAARSASAEQTAQAAQQTGLAPDQVGAEGTVQAVNDHRASLAQSATSAFNPIIEGYISDFAQASPGEALSIPALQDHIGKVINQPVTLAETREILNDYTLSQQPGTGFVLQPDNDGNFVPVNPGGEKVGTPAELSARQAEPVEAAKPAPVAPNVKRAEASAKAMEVIDRHLAPMLKQGAQAQEAHRAIYEVLKDGRYDASQMMAAITASQIAAKYLPANAGYKIDFLGKMIADDAQAALNSGGTAGQEIQGQRIAPTVAANGQAAMDGLIQLSLSKSQLGVIRQTAAHEAFHALQDYYGKHDPAFAKLMSTTFRDGMMIGDVDPTIIRKLQSARIPGSGRKVAGKATSLTYWDQLVATLPGKLSAREAQAYVFGSLVDAADRGVPLTGLKPAFARFVQFLRNVFSQTGKALRGEGFTDAESLLGKVVEGDAKRFDTSATPRVEPAPLPPAPAQAAPTAEPEAAAIPMPAPKGEYSARDVGMSPEKAEFSARQLHLTVPEFQNWWTGGWGARQKRASKAVNKDGSPMRYFHATPHDFAQFGNARSANYGKEGPFFFTADPGFAQNYSDGSMSAGVSTPKDGGRTIPVYLSVQNPLDATTKAGKKELVDFIRDVDRSGRLKVEDILLKGPHKMFYDDMANGAFADDDVIDMARRQWEMALADPDTNWQSVEAPLVQKYIRENGYDGFYLSENGAKNLAVYNPAQIKSTFNQFQKGAATNPEFSARSPLADDQVYSDLTDRLTGRAIERSFLKDAMAKFSGQLPGETFRQALVRNTINRAAPLWMLDRVAEENDFSVHSAGMAMEMALNNTGRVQMFIEHGTHGFDPVTQDVFIREDTPSLLAALKNRVLPADKREAQTYFIALKERDLRANGREGFTALRDAGGQSIPFTDAMINDIISRAESTHPEWKDAAADLQKINAALLDFAVATGTLDREKADQLASMFYTPFYRMVDEDAQANAGEAVGPRANASLVNLQNVFDRALKGGEAPLGDLFENIIRNADAIMKSGLKNVAMSTAAKTMQLTNQGMPVREKEPGKTMTYRENGKDVHFRVDDPALFTALAGAPRETARGIFKTMQIMASFFREMITAAPGFMIANLWRGKVMAYVQEGLPFWTNTADGLKQALQSSTSLQAISSQTGFGGYTYGMGEKNQAAAFERKMGGGSAINRGWHKFLDPLQKFSEATEMAERIKLYERMKAQGMTDKQAAFQAYLLTPFSRKGMGGGWLGNVLSGLIPLVPFLNAKIQGMYRLYENEKVDTQKLWTAGIPMQIALRGMVLMAFSVALAMRNMGEEPDRWDQLSPDAKFKNDVVMLPGNLNIMIPRAFEVGSWFGALPVFLLDALRQDSGRDLAKLAGNLVTSTFFFNPIPQAMQPMLSAVTNYDFFRNKELETAGDQAKPVGERVNPNTTSVAKGLSKVVNTVSPFEFSPIKAQALLEGHLGSMGTKLLVGIDGMMAAAGMIPGKPAGALGGSTAAQVMGYLTDAGRFVRTEEQMASRFVGEFYKLKTQTDQLTNSLNAAKKTGDTDRVAELKGKAGLPLMLRPAVNKASEALKDVSGKMKVVYAMKIDGEEKAKLLAPLVAKRDAITRKVVMKAREMGVM